LQVENKSLELIVDSVPVYYDSYQIFMYITKSHYQKSIDADNIEKEKPQKTTIKISFLSKEYELKDSIIYF
jgi:hypothetical protein